VNLKIKFDQLYMSKELWLLFCLLSIQFWLHLRKTEVCTFMWHWIC